MRQAIRTKEQNFVLKAKIFGRLNGVKQPMRTSFPRINNLDFTKAKEVSYNLWYIVYFDIAIYATPCKLQADTRVQHPFTIAE